ncbi:wHTH domain-containing protein [Streptomyces griseoluteus]|uniref:wHTH domain-containing protein n=1 Tax=Streptomyces griseoluteus TaxID=29306 RepID=UPI003419BA4F
MTVRRHALLVGVGETPDAQRRFASLTDVVTKDLDTMAEQLAASGYGVTTLRPGGERPVDKGAITSALEAAARWDCDLLLVYFTGHGVHLDGRDYLVPASARAPEPGGQWTDGQRESLLPLDVSRYLTGCRAESVVLVVDACRGDQPEEDAAGFGAATVHAPSRRLALLVGCAKGQRCHYGSEGSHFTSALAEALNPLTPERTVEAVFHRAQARTTALAHRHGGHRQTPAVSPAPHDEGLSGFPELCDGTEIPLRWSEAVRKAGIWTSPVGEDGPDSAMRDRVAGFAHRCATSVLRDSTRFTDPWQDSGLPERVLRRVVPALLPPGQDWSPLEKGLLAGLPFLREAMWAHKLSRLAEIDPWDLDQDPQGTEGPTPMMGAELRNIHESHPQLLRKARGHHRRGEDEEYRALAAWLAHRWVAEQMVEEPDPGGVGLAEDLATALLGPELAHKAEQLRWHLVSAVRFLANDPLDSAQYNDLLGSSPTTLTTSEGPSAVRWWGLLGQLRLGGVLAADVRMFPDVLPDHVGVADPIMPGDVVHDLQQELEWTREDDGLHLNMVCRHPALHESLVDVTHRADEVLRALASARHRQPGDLLTGLPGRVTARDLQAARQQNSEDRVYSVPLLRFTLAQDEIRELLMGHQLYGDRSLAVRELYQNAADACRYRAMRWEYLDRRDREPYPWRGEIRITQGRETTADGRPGRAFIECRDNGVGMSRSVLEHTFSRAGRRFSQTRAFRQEQARWLAEDPELRLYPYSRFGIGVLSYFMIADEVSLVTREVRTGGTTAGQALVVDISSSSGLFRIRPYSDNDPDPMREGGTRVRLMLSEPEPGDEPLSVLKVMSHQVRLSEYRLTLEEDGREPLVREPDRLHHPAPEDEPAPAEPLNARGPVWWVSGIGAVLSDGIITSTTPFGYVINLSGPQVPKLSVNRNSVLEWDREWAGERVRAAADDLPGWEGLDLEWLWQLEKKDVGLAGAVAERLAGRELALPMYRSPEHQQLRVALDVVGWFPDDQALLPPRPGEATSGMNRFASAWRRAVLHDQGAALPSTDPAEAENNLLPKDISGHPVPLPGDNALLDNASGSVRSLVVHALRHHRTVADVLRSLRRYALLTPQLYIPAVQQDDTASLDFVPESVDLDLINWMTDWAQPGRTVRQPALGALFSISASSRLCLEALLKRALRYRPLGLVIPKVPAALLEHRATVRDAELLAGWTETGHAYSNRGLPTEVLPVHIARLADRLGTTSADVLEQLRQWERFGYRLPAEDELLPAAPSDTQWEMFRAFWEPDDGAPDPSLQSLLALAARRETTVDEVLRSVGDLAGPSAGLLPELPRQQQDDLSPLARADLKLLTVDGDDGQVLRTRSVPLDLLALCHAPGAAFLGLGSDQDLEPWDSFVTRVRRLAAFGMQVPADLAPLRYWVELSPRDRLAVLIGSLDPTVPWTAATLVYTAGALGESLGDSLARLAKHAPHLGKQVPALPAEYLALTPSEADSELLTDVIDLDSADHIRADWSAPPPLHLIQYALRSTLTVGEVFDRLAPYRALGALLPELTEEDRQLVHPVEPERYEILALCTGRNTQIPRESPTLTPFEIVAVAARAGRPVREVYDRLRCYEPLGIVVDAPEAPDELPLWQDLILLSEGLNGRAPAVSGTVPPERVAALARELDTDTAWVADRLALYATMFGLHVPKDGDAPQPEEEPA